MKNYIQPGNCLEFIAPGGGVVSGGVYQINETVVVATHDAAAGAAFQGCVEGVFEVPKVQAQAWTAGQLVYWDNGAGKFTTVGAAGIKRAGIAAAAAANPSDVGRVKLHSVAVPNGV